MGRSLDQIVMDELGIAHMTIARLMWQIEELKDQVDALKQVVPAPDPPKD